MKRSALLVAGAVLAASCSAAEAELARMEQLPQVISVDNEGDQAVTYDPAVISDEEQTQDSSANDDGSDLPDTDAAPDDPDVASSDTTSPADPDVVTPEPNEEPDDPASSVTVVTPTIIERYPHDGAAFTQGLEFGNGVLIESLGLLGESARRQVEVTSGDVIGSAQLGNDQFGAGLTVVDTRVIQLTWQQGVAIVADLITLTELSRFTFEGEGWGLCDLDDGRLAMSNGSGFLTFRDQDSFEPIAELEVTRDGQPVENLNELECVGTSIYANVWLENDILEIDATTGVVIRVIDATALVPDDLAPDDVLNGIAYRAETDTFFLTGKRWTVMYEVSFG